LLPDELVLDGQKVAHLTLRDVEAVGVERAGSGNEPDRRVHGLRLAVTATEDPLEHAAVLAEARPQELPVAVLAEPVDAEDLRELRLVVLLANLEPVGEVIA